MHGVRERGGEMIEVIAQPGSVVSNRTFSPPLIGGAPRGPVGVDFLAISFPIISYDGDVNMWDEVWLKPFGRSVDMVVDRVPVRISFLEMPSGPWGRLAFNPARWSDPEGCSFLETNELLPALSWGWDLVSELMTPMESVSEARLKRIDLGRDFTVRHPDFFIRGLLNGPHGPAKEAVVWHDPDGSGALTLKLGFKINYVRLYDEHVKRPHLAPYGTLRFEAQCGPKWLGRGGMRRARDATPGRLQRLTMDRWKWSGMWAWSPARRRCSRACSDWRWVTA